MKPKTYSDMLSPIRVFLSEYKPDLIEIFEKEDGTITERWLINGSEIILRIEPNGTWDIFVPVSLETGLNAKIKALAMYIQGNRVDINLILDMGNLSRTFLDRLAEFPSCSDPECGQPVCKENQDLRNAINNFLLRLSPNPKKVAP